MDEIVDNCQVEWHKARGVLYVHNKDTGATIIRICGLDKSHTCKLATGQIDINMTERSVSLPGDI